jgi:hypothetical protein
MMSSGGRDISEGCGQQVHRSTSSDSPTNSGSTLRKDLGTRSKDGREKCRRLIQAVIFALVLQAYEHFVPCSNS